MYASVIHVILGQKNDIHPNCWRHERRKGNIPNRFSDVHSYGTRTWIATDTFVQEIVVRGIRLHDELNATRAGG